MASLHWLIPVALTFTTEISTCHFNIFHIIQRSCLCAQKKDSRRYFWNPCLFIIFFVSLLPAGSFKVVNLDVYGSVKVFVVQHIFSLVHVDDNSTLEDICFSWLFLFYPSHWKLLRQKGKKIKRKSFLLAWIPLNFCEAHSRSSGPPEKTIDQIHPFSWWMANNWKVKPRDCASIKSDLKDITGLGSHHKSRKIILCST